jgi:acetyltransferase-like isoleucine patch superfamily enzyme
MSGTAAKWSPAERVYAHPQALVESTDIGPGTRIWAFAHVMPGARIGSHCNIGDHAFIESGAIVGDQVTVKNGVAIWGRVTIEDNVFLAPNCVFTNDPNPRSYIKKPMEELTPTLVRGYSTIGANATIVCGVTIGRYAFVGAGAVVLRSLPDHALVVGNPSRQIGWMCVCAEKLPLSASAPPGSRATCLRCRRSFVRTPNALSNLAESNNDE